MYKLQPSDQDFLAWRSTGARQGFPASGSIYRSVVNRRSPRRLAGSVTSAGVLAGLVVAFVVGAIEVAPLPECRPDNPFCGFPEVGRAVLIGTAVATVLWALLLLLVLFRLGFSDLRWIGVVAAGVAFSTPLVLMPLGWSMPLTVAGAGTWLLQGDAGPLRSWGDLRLGLRASLVPSQAASDGIAPEPDVPLA